MSPVSEAFFREANMFLNCCSTNWVNSDLVIASELRVLSVDLTMFLRMKIIFSMLKAGSPEGLCGFPAKLISSMIMLLILSDSFAIS